MTRVDRDQRSGDGLGRCVEKHEMKYQGVIFDLFGTLITNWSIEQYDSVVGRIAATLGVNRGVLDNLIRLDWAGISRNGESRL